MKIDRTLNPYDLEGCYVAGGAVTSFYTKQPIKDYDIYPKNKEGMFHAFETLLSDGVIVHMSERAVTFKCAHTDFEGNRTVWQVIVDKFYPTPESIFESFDFTVCMAAYDCDTERVEAHERFWPDLASRTIHFNPGTSWSFASLVRTNKYRAKGYKIPKAELLKLALTMNRAESPSSWEELSRQIGGVYGKFVEIGSEEREFSFEAAIEVLDGMDDEDLKLKEPNSDKYRGIKSTFLTSYFDRDSPLYYYHHHATDFYMLFDKDDQILNVIDAEKVEEMCIPDHWIEMGDEWLIRSYKYVKPDDTSSSFLPPSQNYNDIRYNVGQITEWEKDPYLFVGKEINMYAGSSGKQNTLISVLFRPSDVQKMSTGADPVLQVSRLHVEGIIEAGEGEKPTTKYQIVPNRRF